MKLNIANTKNIANIEMNMANMEINAANVDMNIEMI